VEAALDAAYSSGIPGLELNILLFNDPRYTVRFELDEIFSKVDAADLPHFQPENDVWTPVLKLSLCLITLIHVCAG
jgi:hypothetical protein